jgi:pimeloyl-ACP methyl ester carboxylesterase
VIVRTSDDGRVDNRGGRVRSRSSSVYRLADRKIGRVGRIERHRDTGTVRFAARIKGVPGPCGVYPFTIARSWITDAAGIGDVEFEWHDFAKIWQTPGEGEAFFEQQLAAPMEARAVFELFGVPHERAVQLDGSLDQTMAGCILDLYGSAVELGVEWGPDVADIPKPGLVLAATEDAFLDTALAKRGAARAGADVVVLEGLGHWWMLQEPAAVAPLLTRFWSSC